jgi:hypothetical protein
MSKVHKWITFRKVNKIQLKNYYFNYIDINGFIFDLMTLILEHLRSMKLPTELLTVLCEYMCILFVNGEDWCILVNLTITELQSLNF